MREKCTSQMLSHTHTHTLWHRDTPLCTFLGLVCILCSLPLRFLLLAFHPCLLLLRLYNALFQALFSLGLGFLFARDVVAGLNDNFGCLDFLVVLDVRLGLKWWAHFTCEITRRSHCHSQ